MTLAVLVLDEPLLASMIVSGLVTLAALSLPIPRRDRPDPQRFGAAGGCGRPGAEQQPRAAARGYFAA